MVALEASRILTKVFRGVCMCVCMCVLCNLSVCLCVRGLGQGVDDGGGGNSAALDIAAEVRRTMAELKNTGPSPSEFMASIDAENRKTKKKKQTQAAAESASKAKVPAGGPAHSASKKPRSSPNRGGGGGGGQPNKVRSRTAENTATQRAASINEIPLSVVNANLPKGYAAKHTA